MVTRGLAGTAVGFALLLIVVAGARGKSGVESEPRIIPIHPMVEDVEILYGDPDKPGEPFVMRIRELPGGIIPPHKHSVDENITVLQGTLFFAVGDKFDWKRYKGEHIEALLIKNTQGDIMVQNLKEFEDLTGITVGVDQPPEQQQRQKLTVEFNSGQTSFDVVYYSFHVQKRLFGKNSWVADVRDYLARLSSSGKP